MVPDLAKQGVRRLVIEPIDSLRAQDEASVRAALNRLPVADRVNVDQVAPKLEPALWAADAVAWGYGARGDWRRRIHGLVDATVELRQREARIVSVRRSSGLTS